MTNIDYALGPESVFIYDRQTTSQSKLLTTD